MNKKHAKEIVADDLEKIAGYAAVIEKSAKKILEQRSWNEGWIAVQKTIQHDSKHFDDEVKKRHYRLEKPLMPDNLLEKARTFAILECRTSFFGYPQLLNSLAKAQPTILLDVFLGGNDV